MTQEPKRCPKCGDVIVGYPALSRRDNKTDLCSRCGVIEAIEDNTKVSARDEKLPKFCYVDVDGNVSMLVRGMGGHISCPGFSGVCAADLNAKLGVTESTADTMACRSMKTWRM